MSRLLNTLMRSLRVWECNKSTLDLCSDSPSLDDHRDIWVRRTGFLWDRNGEVRYVSPGVIWNALAHHCDLVAWEAADLGLFTEFPLEVTWDQAEPLSDMHLRTDVIPSGGDGGSDR